MAECIAKPGASDAIYLTCQFTQFSQDTSAHKSQSAALHRRVVGTRLGASQSAP